LPISPLTKEQKLPNMKKILITGATGYIGRRLTDFLTSKPALDIRLLVRNKGKINPAIADQTEVVEGDTFNRESLAKALSGIHTAYYLIHSMEAGSQFEGLDKKSAQNFRDACLAAGVKRIIYLGGLGVKETASKHLLSRIETGEVLAADSSIQVIWFRAGVIIGSGSASFEIITNLIQKLPVMITPTWVNTLTQPISVNDVVRYLTAALEYSADDNVTIDIGTTPMSFKEMMREQDVLFAGELSGHFYFKDNFYTDSGVIAALKMIQIISEKGKKLSELLYFKNKDRNYPIKYQAQNYENGNINKNCSYHPRNSPSF